MIFAQNYNNLVKEQKTLMDEQFNDLAKWRARQKEKEAQMQRQLEEEQQRHAIQEIRDKQLQSLLQKVEEDEVEMQLMQMRKRGEMEIDQFEYLKSKKENNVKDIKNQVIHSKITSQLQKSEEQVNIIGNKLKGMTLNQ